MSLETQQATVYYAPTKRRRFFTKKAAVHAEAVAIIFKHYPPIPFEPDTGECWCIMVDEPDNFDRLYKRLVNVLKRVQS